MKAAYIENGLVLTGEMPEPVPGKGQALVRTHACGLCASDSHFLSSGQHIIDLSKRLGGPYAALDFARPFIPGHEFVGEVIDFGPGSRRLAKDWEGSIASSTAWATIASIRMLTRRIASLSTH